MGVLRRNGAGQHLQIPMNLLSLLLLPLTAVVAGKNNCGLSCYRWAKCMGQLDGSNRPGQLGDTGIIVLMACKPMEGKCDCAALVMESVSTTTEAQPRSETHFTPERVPRRRGRKYGGRKSSKPKKEQEMKRKEEELNRKEEVTKSSIKPKRKYRRNKDRFHRDETSEEVTSTTSTTTEKTGYRRRTRSKNRKFRLRKRL